MLESVLSVKVGESVANDLYNRLRTTPRNPLKGWQHKLKNIAWLMHMSISHCKYIYIYKRSGNYATMFFFFFFIFQHQGLLKQQ